MSIFQQISSVLTNTVQKLILNYASQLLILTLILFCFAGYVTYQSRATLAEIENAERMIDATNISHCLFKAMGKWAYERGLTHSALNSGTKITQEVQDKITKAISESDNHFQWLYQELENSDYIDEHGKDILADIKKNKKDISALRFEASEKIIKNNNKKIKKIDDKLFNKYIEMIENAYELQEGISVSISCEEDEDECGILLSNIKLLQNIWMVREYAGRERAIISAYIARNEQFKINELLGYRNEVNDSLEIINEYMKDNVDRLGATPVHSSLFKINDDFLKKLEEARNDIYNKNKLKINQTISSIEWFEVSSKGIDAFQGFAAAVSDDSKLIIKSLKQNNMDKLHEYKTSIALILIITAFMFFLLFKKIVLVIKSAILFNKGHKIAGLLFNSSGSSARERGKTYLMLNTINKDENSIELDDIYKSRQMTSSNISMVIDLLSDKKISFGGKERIVKNIEAAYAKIQEYRIIISPYFISDEIPKDEALATNWFDNCTIFINHISTLHLAILNHVSIWSNKANDSEVSKLATLRHYLFEMSEYAGRERAIIGGALVIATLNNKHNGDLEKYCQEHFDDLESYRKAIDNAWDISRSILCRQCSNSSCRNDPLRSFNQCHSADYKSIISNEIRAAAEKTVKTFVFDFSNTRDDIHKLIYSNHNYSGVSSNGTFADSANLSPDKWFKNATDAIDSIVSLAIEVGKDIDDKTCKAEQNGKKLLGLLIFTGGIGIGVAVWSFWALS